jgi:muconate cycloisomerase
MNITDLKTTILSVPFSKPTLWPYGRWEGMTVVVIELETDAGITGLGESACIQSSAEAVDTLLKSTKPLLIGQDPFDTELIAKRLEGLGSWTYMRHFGGYALGGIDMALWDIVGKACHQPVYKLLGGNIRNRAECFKYIHHGDPSVMAADAHSAVSQGYRTIYCKYTTIEHLEKAIRAMREAIGEEPRLWVDFNTTLSPGFTVAFLKKMEKFRIDIIEQPILPSNLEGMAYVRNSVSAQVLAHESSWTLYETLNVINAGAADIISVDPRMTWGMMACKKAAAVAEAAGLPVVMHSSAELGIAQAACMHLIASTPNFILANQCMYDWYDEDYIKSGALSFDGPFLSVPQGPGLGVELDTDKMTKFHETYKEVGTFSLSRLNTEEARSARPPLFPSY